MKKLSSPEYHNVLAHEYDQTMAHTPSNEFVRRRVAEYFCRTVTGDRVMDFGGGTGLDLPWLLDKNYNIFFCEPAEDMKRVAKDNYPANEQIVFLENKSCDFTTWNQENLPIQCPLDGILANFAVLNCIEDIGVLFKKFALVVASGNHVIALVLDGRPTKLLMKYKRNILKSFLRNEKIIVSSVYQNLVHQAFLHTPKSFENCANPYFDLLKVKPLGGIGYLLIDFLRNDKKV